MLDASTRQNIIGQLNDLIALDHDAIAAYDSAIEHLQDAEIRRRMQLYREDHDRHVEFLQSKVRSLGGQPREGADFQQVLTQGLVIAAGIMGDDESILKAMKTNEDKTNKAYEEAVTALFGTVEGARSYLVSQRAEAGLVDKEKLVSLLLQYPDGALLARATASRFLAAVLISELNTFGILVWPQGTLVMTSRPAV